MSTRSSLTARNSNVAKDFRPNPERAKNLSRGALLLGTALGCSIAVFALGAPGTASAQTCTPVVSGGVDTVTCTPGTYPTGITVTDPANPIVVTVQSGATITGGLAAEGASGTYTNVTVAAGSTISGAVTGEELYNGGGAIYLANGADISASFEGIVAVDGDSTIFNTGNITISGSYIAGGIVTGENEFSYVNNSGAINISGNMSREAVGIYAIGTVYDKVVNTGSITIDNTGTGYTAGITSRNFKGYVPDVVSITAGTINVTSGGYAIGVNANSYDSSSFTGTGAITVTGAYAVGVSLHSNYGDVYGNHTGDITVTGQTGAVGMSIYGYDVDVVQNGNISVSTISGDATALSVGGYFGEVVVNGNVTAYSENGNATGLNARGYYGYGYGCCSVAKADEECGVKPNLSSHSGPGLVTAVYGDVVAIAPLGTATGEVLTTGGGEYGYVYVSGNVVALGFTGATGISLTTGGNAYVTVGGNVIADTVFGDATGIDVNSAYDVNIHVGGSVGAYTTFGDAVGINAPANDGSVYIGVGGNVVASSIYGNATGIQSYGYDGSTIKVGGSVEAYSKYGNATGINTSAYNSMYTRVGGDVTAIADHGYATGITSYVTKGSDYTDTVIVGGNVTAYGRYGAVGVEVFNLSGGNSSVSIGGDVVAESYVGTAVGVISVSAGSSSVSVGGSVIAESGLSYAAGVVSLSDYNSSVTVGGSVIAEGYIGAIGVRSQAYVDGFSSEVSVGGDVVAETVFGNATGVKSYAEGYAYARVGGNVIAETGNGYAVGVNVYSEDGVIANATAEVYGNVTVVGSSGATGVEARAYGDASVFVGGNITAVAIGGEAIGALAESGYTSSVTVEGSIVAVGTYAVGAEAEGRWAYVTVGGNVTAAASGGEAIGVAAVSAYQSDISVDGNIVAVSVGGTAVGALAEAIDGNVSISVDGGVTAESFGGSGAIGVAGIAEYDVTVFVDGPILAEGNIAAGVLAESYNGGSVFVDVGNVTVHQYSGVYGGTGSGIRTATTGTTHIYASYVYTTGNYTDGIKAGSNTLVGGDTYVDVSSVRTTGAFSTGVDVYGAGNASVTAGYVKTLGYSSDGIIAVSYTGGATVNAGTVVTYGDFSTGIYAAAGGPVNVTSGFVETFGNYAPGVYAKNIGTTLTDTVTVTSGTAITHGAYSPGIYAYAYNGVSVTSTYVKTTGYYSPGIEAFSYNGPVTVNSNTVITDGDYSTGIVAESPYGSVGITSQYVRTYGYSAAGIVGASFFGNVYINSGAVITSGDYSPGIVGESFYGDVTIESQYVKTTGFESYGIFGENVFGDVTINSGTVLTYGDFSPGIIGDSTEGNVSITSQYVKTTGYDSIGIFAYSRYGNVSVNSGTVITYGDYATGIHAYSYDGTATVNSDYVKTYGYRAEGIYANGYAGVTIDSGTVRTYGDYADGIHAISNGGTVNVTSNYVKTMGTGSVGIYAYGWYGASVNSGTVKTYGDFAPGIEAIAPYGEANVTSHYVKTYGFESTGIFAYGYFGATVNNTGAVRTYGDYANGITAEAYDGNVNVTSNEVITHGYDSVGIKAYATHGDVTVNAGETVTYGDNSRGISAVSAYGNVSVTSEDVATYGFKSYGITAVTDYGGNIFVDSDFVYTYGDYSQGIRAHAHAFGGNVTVYSGDVITEGFYAPGIVALADYGTVKVYSDFVRTYGELSTGIEAEGYFGTKVYSGSVETYGNFADGIYARSIFGDTLVETYGDTFTSGFDSSGVVAVSIYGNATVVNYGTVHAQYGVGVAAVSETGYASVYNFGHIYGGYVGVEVESNLGSYIYNKGTIQGGNGFAIAAYGAPVYIENRGTIDGYAILNTSNNFVDNRGTWNAYGDSYFGYGNDTFNNHGVVHVAPFSSSPTTVIWDGVTVFNNSNLVDLRNGHTGDVFILNGNGGVGTVWNGLAGSTLAVDASLTTALTSDEMIIGAANGSTSLVVQDVNPGSPGSLNFVGTTVVHAASGTASNFTWGGEQKGFIQYELQFFSGPVNWNIVALPGQAAFEMLKAPEMAEDFWRRTGDAWSAREQEVRDSMWGSAPPTRGEGWEMWAQAQIGGERLDRTESFDVHGLTFTPNLSTDTDWRGFQMGGDNWTSKNWLWGFTGGFLEQNSIFHTDKNSFDITGWNVGAYTGFTSGSFFANALLKGDWYDVKANMHTVPALETFSGDTWGAKGEMGFRLGSTHLYFEPLADLAWTTTHLDNANFPAQVTSFTFGNSQDLRGSIGGRVGGQWGSLLPYVGLYAAEEFDGNNKMTMITSGGCPGACMSIQDTKPGAYGKADFGFTTTSWNGLEGFLKGEAEFGSKTNGFIGRLGLRWRW